jgi:Acetyltransferase (GNAT) family
MNAGVPGGVDVSIALSGRTARYEETNPSAPPPLPVRVAPARMERVPLASHGVPCPRRIRPEERDESLRTLVEAFRTDPQLRWYFPDDARYDVGAPRFFGVLLDTRIEGGEVWVMPDLSAVSLWIPPGGNLLGPDVVEARYAEAVVGLPAPAPGRITATDDLVDMLLPREPHWYLGVVATRLASRERGLASAVLAPVLAAADRGGFPVALETSTPRNVEYYTRRGFATLGSRAVMGAGSPVVRVMQREPMPVLRRP